MAAYKEGAGDKESPVQIPQQADADLHAEIGNTLSADSNMAKTPEAKRNKKERLQVNLELFQ